MHGAPMAGDWSDNQNDAIVVDCLRSDIVARPDKAEHNRLLQPTIGPCRARLTTSHRISALSSSASERPRVDSGGHSRNTSLHGEVSSISHGPDVFGAGRPHPAAGPAAAEGRAGPVSERTG